MVSAWFHASRNRSALAVLIGALVLAASAQIVIEVGSIPSTMQTVAILLIGTFFGGRLAALTAAVYVLGGSVGMPWFSGLDADMSITGGYLLGFIPAAAIVGWYSERGACDTFSSRLGVYMQGLSIIYVGGVLWLVLRAQYSLSDALTLGVHSTLVHDVIECSILSGAFVIYNRIRTTSGK